MLLCDGTKRASIKPKSKSRKSALVASINWTEIKSLTRGSPERTLIDTLTLVAFSAEYEQRSDRIRRISERDVWIVLNMLQTKMWFVPADELVESAI